MSLKDLFKENKNLKSFEPTSTEDYKNEIESFDYAEAIRTRDARFVAIENFSDPSKFARFGSAEKYYEDSIRRIYNTYPYDGSLKEKVLWEISSSLIDLYLFENGYPRTTGYANFVTAGATDANVGADGYFPSSGDDEYILVKGGPHAGTGVSLYYSPITDSVTYRQDANIYDLENNRENNLLIDGEKGNTVEFWLKKDAFVNPKETIFDVAVTGALSSSADYARLTVGLDTSSADGPFDIVYQFGINGLSASIGSSLTTDSIADGNWHHYALRMKNNSTDNNIVLDLFVDGKHNERITTGTAIGYVSGALVAAVGALVDTPSGSFFGYDATSPQRGWAKLSGSLDEFRYWKTFRSSKKIQRYWFDQVGGGTNTDVSNTDLGVYFKFNEGITGDASIDSIALDYSGRISNGTWTGYSTNSRNVGSAILEASASAIEFKDPIIYSSHSDVVTYLSNMKASGSVHDVTNANSMISYMPAWMLEENETDSDQKSKDHLWNLLQIMSSYFDEASILLEKLPELGHKKYYTSGSSPPPFNIKALESHGFIVPDIFINASLLERFEDRDDELKFENSLQEVKNIIYQNIYNNLDFIYKSKGTEKAFRNLFHCFGIGDNALKFNIYANNAEYKLEDNLKFVTKTKNYINFNELENKQATIHQAQIDSNSTSYISGSSLLTNDFSFTLESNVVLPNRVDISEYATVTKANAENKAANLYPLVINSSLFGVHTGNGSETDLSWDTNDYANFQVSTVKNNKFSRDAYFKLTSTAGSNIPELTSPTFEDVYSDQTWTIAVSVEPTTDSFNNTKSTLFSGDEEKVDIGSAATWDSIIGIDWPGLSERVDGTVGPLTLGRSSETYTLAAWINPTEIDHAGGGDLPRIFDFGNFDLALRIIGDGGSDHGELSLVHRFTGDYGYWYTNGAVIDERLTEWFHVAVTYDPTSILNDPVFYINGEKIDTLRDSNPNRTPKGVNYGIYGQTCYIGNNPAETRTFKGHIDEAAVYNKVLSPAEISEIYNNGKALNLNKSSAASSLVGWWRMGENIIGSPPDYTILDRIGTNNGIMDSFDGTSTSGIVSDTVAPFDSPTGEFYTVNFYGVNYIADYKAQEFLVTDTMTKGDGDNFLSSHKRIFAGSHRTNFTGSVLQETDVKVNSCKAWINTISTGTIDQHNLRIGTYGTDSPTQNTFLDQVGLSGTYVPKNDTLALLWDFSTVTGSDSNGKFTVEDETSGNATDNRYGWFSDLVSRRHTASGSNFNASSTDVVQALERATYQVQVPEVLTDSSLIRILSKDDEYFTRNTRPVKYHLSIEKNMFQDISEEMLNMFGSVVYFNKLIGEPVNIYRGEYKELKKAADLFFEKVDNDYDFDKYVEYFKFIDYAVSRYIDKLIPASLSTFDDGISTVIENFALGDRNKYWSKFPIIKDVTPGFLGDIQSNLIYSFTPDQDGAPLEESLQPENKHCRWWRNRAERNNPSITSGDSGVDADRQSILDSINNRTNSGDVILYDTSSGDTYYKQNYYSRTAITNRLKGIADVTTQGLSGGPNSYQTKKIGFWDTLRKPSTPASHIDDNWGHITIKPASGSALESFKDCIDDRALFEKRGKRRYSFSAIATAGTTTGQYSVNDKYKGDLIFPFSLYSSSVSSTSRGDVADFKSDLEITDLHHDVYDSSREIPMQGPFTEKYVGGRPYRHVFTSFTPDNATLDAPGKRLEGWRIQADSDNLTLANPDAPRSVYFRDGIAKRPVNIANIRQLTGAAATDDQYIHPTQATIIGNYTKDYEIVMTNGRSTNNRYFVKSEGDVPPGQVGNDSTYIFGLIDFTLSSWDSTGKNDFIIVNRFSAPGDPATMGEGMLDIISGEYSVYNALPWRNLSVRLPLQELLSDHANQFGYFSDAFTVAAYDLADETYPGGNNTVNAADYSGTGSFHKINRNTRKMIDFVGDSGYGDNNYLTRSVYDNAYVTHPIPQSDMQYAWVTGNTENIIYGYEEKDFSRADYASSDIQFVSASNYNSDGVKVDFAGMNTLILDGIDSNLNLLSNSDYFNANIVSSLANTLETNALVLNRGGPFAGSNWKLYKKDDHPIVRYQRNHNIVNVATPSTTPTSVGKQSMSIKNFIEPPGTSKFKPLMFSLPATSDTSQINLLLSHGNLRAHFTNHKQSPDRTDLNVILPTGKSKHKINTITYDPYGAVKVIVEGDNLRPHVQVVYAETIYPMEQYTYLSGTRKRLNFTNDFWRDNRDNRTSTLLSNSTSELIGSASIWKLDSHKYFTSTSASVPYSASLGADVDGSGELQNSYCLFHYGQPSNIKSAANYNRRIKLIYRNINELPNQDAEFYSERTDIAATAMPSFNGLTDSIAPARFSASVGDTLWEASSSSGEKPFYDSYDLYAEEGFRSLKNGTVLPEFRISEKISDYVSAGSQLNYLNYNPKSFFNKAELGSLNVHTGLLSLTGSSILDSDLPTFLERYVFSDFYEYFQIINEDYGYAPSEFKRPAWAKHKLICEAMLKFLPYDGFYPSERCVQLGGLFSQSLDSASLKLTGPHANLRTAMQPFYAPGVLFNSIKSGIAVDYPIFTNSSSFAEGSEGSLIWGSCISGDFNKRLNVDDLLIPPSITIFDAEADDDLAIESTASIAGVDSKYTFAVSNFLAQTEHMFVGSDNFSSIESQPFDVPENIVVNKTGEYTMDIVLRNSTNIVSDIDFENAKDAMYGGSGSNHEYFGFPSLTSSLQVNSASVTMYDRAITGYNIDPFLYGSSFGPPVYSGEMATTGSTASMYSASAEKPQGTSFDPFTSPSYNGYAKVRLFINLEADIYYDLDRIITDMSYSYDRLNTFLYPTYPIGTTSEINEASALAASLDTTAYKHAMQLSASLYLGAEDKKSVIYEGELMSNLSSSPVSKQKLSIRPRWETPVLDFSNANPTLSYISGNVAKGMWHQYGEIPSASRGLVLEAQSNTDLSLAQVLKINTKQHSYIGQLNDKETFSEAIVIIPFKYDNAKNDTALYNINEETLRAIKDNMHVQKNNKFDPFSPILSLQQLNQKAAADLPSDVDSIDESLYNLMVMMRKYVIPPNLDFLHDDSINPFVMFMMEFSVDLNQKDLQNIWQNIEPTFARKAIKARSETNVHLMNTTSFTPSSTPYFNFDYFKAENTRWAVFKVKKRAKSNYNAIVGKTKDGLIRQDLIDNVNDFLYSYNWPYDFFSLIELAKFDSITTFNPIYNDDESD